MKSFYNPEVILTEEGIALLSGIPGVGRRALPAEVAKDVEKANQILILLFETVCRSHEGPPIQVWSWQAPLEIFGKVVKARLDRVASLCRAQDLSDDEAYQAVWKKTIDLLAHIERIGLEPNLEPFGMDHLHGALGYGHESSSEEMQISLRFYSPSMLRFVDHLAKVRDQIWQATRLSRSPSTTALQAPWPLGLPIQYLLSPFDIDSMNLTQDLAPYVCSRSYQVVFLTSTEARGSVPEDVEMLSAIGPFVDSYATALKLYVYQGSSTSERQKRISSAWNHAIQHLTHENMTPEEAIRTWDAIFKKALPDCETPITVTKECQPMWPLIPEYDENRCSGEWNPSSEAPLVANYRRRPPSCIDCMVEAHFLASTRLTTAFITPNDTIVKVSPSSVWDLSRFKQLQKVPSAVQESLAVSALLYLDNRIGGARSILLTAFPTKNNDIRYPPLFLGEEFLAANRFWSDRKLLRTLQKLRNFIPTALLFQLSTKALEMLASVKPPVSGRSSLITITIGLVALLTRSDQPMLASDLVERIVVNHPDISSHYCSLLNTGFMKRLVPHDVVSLLNHLVTSAEPNTKQPKSKLSHSFLEHSRAAVGIERTTSHAIVRKCAGSKLDTPCDPPCSQGTPTQERPYDSAIPDVPDNWRHSDSKWRFDGSKSKRDHSEICNHYLQLLQNPGKNANSYDTSEDHCNTNTDFFDLAFLKVTTVKLLIQLLKRSDLVTPDTAVEILSHVLYNTNNADIRVTVVECPLGILQAPFNDGSPSSVSERVVQILEGLVPLLGGPNERKLMNERDWMNSGLQQTLPEVSDDSPLWDSTVKIGMNRSVPATTRRRLMQRIIEPVVAESILTNARWAKAFAQQRNVVAVDDLPGNYPIRTKMIPDLLTNCIEWVPLSLLRIYQDFRISTIRLPSQIAAINEAILADKTSCASNEGLHWLSQHKQDAQVGQDFILARQLTTERHSLLGRELSDESIEIHHIQVVVESLDVNCS